MRSSSTIVVAVMAALLTAVACNRTIEDDEPELIEHRIEPCRQICDAMHDPDCGAVPLPPRTADECFVACAKRGSGFQWGLLPDGTDACYDEAIAQIDCILALDCEGRRLALSGGEGRPCEAEAAAKADCYYTTPNLEREDPPP